MLVTKKLFKKSLGVLLITSSFLSSSTINAATVSMIGDVSLSQPNVNFNPQFNNGDTIMVESGGKIAVPSGGYNIGALYLDKAAVSNLFVPETNAGGGVSFQIGAIAGNYYVNSIVLTMTNITSGHIILTGNAGEGGLTGPNDYSRLLAILARDVGAAAGNNQGSSITINAPIILNATITNNDGCKLTININNKVTFTNTLTILGNKNLFTNIAANQSLTLTQNDQLVKNSGGTFYFNLGARSELNINGANTTLPGVINFTDVGATLNMNGSNGTISGAIQNGANGTLNVNNSVTASDGSIGTFGKINIASSLTSTANDTNFPYGVNFTQSNATLTVAGANSIIFGTIDGSKDGIGSFNINGDTLLSSPTIDLGLNTLNYNGNAETSGTMTMILKHSGAISGNISVAGGNLDLSGLNQLIITPLANLYDLPEKEYVYTLISTNGGTITPIDESKITVSSGNGISRFIEYSMNNNLTLRIKDISDQVLITDLGNWITDPNNQLIPEETAFVNLLTGQSFDTLTDAIVFLNNLGFSNVDRARETIDRVITSAPPSSSNYNNLTIQSQNAISLASTAVSNRMTEVSAGDETLKGSYGLWVSPLFSRGIKRHESGLNGYKEKSEGIMLGADTLINDQFLLGFSYGRIHNKLSYKDLRDGDNTKARSNIFALYGSYNELGNPWLTETILSFANSRIKNKATRLIYNDVEIAASNFKSKAYGGQVLEGYNFLMANNITLTPLAGIRYGYYKNSSYQETGTSFQNLRVKGKSYSKIEGIAGFRSSTDWQYKKFAFIPEFHGYLDYNFSNKKSPSIDVRLQGINAPLPVKQYKAPRALFTLGTSITAKSGKMEFGAGFDAFLAKKYYAYQGSLKLRINL